MLVEISGDDMFFAAISRTGKTVDSGKIHREAKAGSAERLESHGMKSNDTTPAAVEMISHGR